MLRQNNKRKGRDFEKELLRQLAKNGFWCHKLIENENGAPFDLIAVKSGICYAFECKEVSGKRFVLSRVEDNQKTGFSRAEPAGIQGYFAFQNEDGIYLAAAKTILDCTERSILIDRFKKMEDWLQDENKD